MEGGKGGGREGEERDEGGVPVPWTYRCPRLTCSLGSDWSTAAPPQASWQWHLGCYPVSAPCGPSPGRGVTLWVLSISAWECGT